MHTCSYSFNIHSHPTVGLSGVKDMTKCGTSLCLKRYSTCTIGTFESLHIHFPLNVGLTSHYRLMVRRQWVTGTVWMSPDLNQHHLCYITCVTPTISTHWHCSHCSTIYTYTPCLHLGLFREPCHDDHDVICDVRAGLQGDGLAHQHAASLRDGNVCQWAQQ